MSSASQPGLPGIPTGRAPVRIVCVGNAYRPGDDLGPRVHAALARTDLPEGIDLVDGGLGGLGLLRELEGASGVVFVDALAGFGRPGEPIELRGRQALGALDPRDGHGGGLAYLLHLLVERPEVCAGPTPRWVLAGFEGPADEPAVTAVARHALACARALGSGRP
jgi:hydrogenase maturation protease